VPTHHFCLHSSRFANRQLIPLHLMLSFQNQDVGVSTLLVLANRRVDWTKICWVPSRTKLNFFQEFLDRAADNKECLFPYLGRNNEENRFVFAKTYCSAPRKCKNWRHFGIQRRCCKNLERVSCTRKLQRTPQDDGLTWKNAVNEAVTHHAVKVSYNIVKLGANYIIINMQKSLAGVHSFVRSKSLTLQNWPIQNNFGKDIEDRQEKLKHLQEE